MEKALVTPVFTSLIHVMKIFWHVASELITGLVTVGGAEVGVEEVGVDEIGVEDVGGLVEDAGGRDDEMTGGLVEDAGGRDDDEMTAHPGEELMELYWK